MAHRIHHIRRKVQKATRPYVNYKRDAKIARTPPHRQGRRGHFHDPGYVKQRARYLLEQMSAKPDDIQDGSKEITSPAHGNALITKPVVTALLQKQQSENQLHQQQYDNEQQAELLQRRAVAVDNLAAAKARLLGFQMKVVGDLQGHDPEKLLGVAQSYMRKQLEEMGTIRSKARQQKAAADALRARGASATAQQLLSEKDEVAARRPLPPHLADAVERSVLHSLPQEAVRSVSSLLKRYPVELSYQLVTLLPKILELRKQVDRAEKTAESHHKPSWMQGKPQHQVTGASIAHQPLRLAQTDALRKFKVDTRTQSQREEHKKAEREKAAQQRETEHRRGGGRSTLRWLLGKQRSKRTRKSSFAIVDQQNGGIAAELKTAAGAGTTEKVTKALMGKGTGSKLKQGLGIGKGKGKIIAALLGKGKGKRKKAFMDGPVWAPPEGKMTCQPNYCHIPKHTQLPPFVHHEPKDCGPEKYIRKGSKPFCQKGFQKNGLLCYPNCIKGYAGAGPVCWQKCPEGFHDDGAFCRKGEGYRRGVGVFKGIAMKRELVLGIKYERRGLLWYPKCKKGFKPFGCCICKPACPPGFKDIGISCAKKSYGRTAGIPPGCPPGKMKIVGRCFLPCKAGTVGAPYMPIAANVCQKKPACNAAGAKWAQEMMALRPGSLTSTNWRQHRPGSVLKKIEDAKSCWTRSYPRGAGVVITNCKDGLEKNGALCYKKCRPGYNGVGPVCWQNCDMGTLDQGAFCHKRPGYGRGAKPMLKCIVKGKNTCEKKGLLWYPKCKKGFHSVGCCICSAKCTLGMHDIGISCAKKSYGRGAGTPLVCANGFQEQAALCYEPCEWNFVGKGPVCWQQKCHRGTVKCGPALCLKQGASCSKTIETIVNEVTTVIGDIVATILSAGAQAPTLVKDAQILYKTIMKYFPVCPL